ncbi:MAG: hypothetical protein E7516_05325 [Ruminococcaceae bacterium]|nr:hypothetical protein [Oscillospiraceae bacterium]
MKKYFALIITAIIVLTCFTACKPKIKGGGIVSDAASNNYAAVTKEDGGIVRDDAGNLVVLVTDANGRNVKDDSGEYETKAVAIEHALVIGNRIECPKYSLVIPNGWSDKTSFADLIISRDGTKDIVKISSTEEKTPDELTNEKIKALNNIKSLYPGSESGAREVSIRDDIKGEFSYVYVADTGARDENLNILSSYVGFIIFRNGATVYSCMITSDRDMSAHIDEIVEILGTMDFIGE